MLACFLLSKFANSAQGANAEGRKRPSCFLLVYRGRWFPPAVPAFLTFPFFILSCSSFPSCRGQSPPPTVAVFLLAFLERVLLSTAADKTADCWQGAAGSSTQGKFFTPCFRGAA